MARGNVEVAVLSLRVDPGAKPGIWFTEITQVGCHKAANRQMQIHHRSDNDRFAWVFREAPRINGCQELIRVWVRRDPTAFNRRNCDAERVLLEPQLIELVSKPQCRLFLSHRVAPGIAYNAVSSWHSF